MESDKYHSIHVRFRKKGTRAERQALAELRKRAEKNYCSLSSYCMQVLLRHTEKDAAQ